MFVPKKIIKASIYNDKYNKQGNLKIYDNHNTHHNNKQTSEMNLICGM